MGSFTDRTELILGKEGIEKLKASKVILFGVGGVGGYIAECLTRAGIGHLTVVDGDVVDVTNINRQIVSLSSNVGLPKTEAAFNRLKEINPDADIKAVQKFITAENITEINLESYDYGIDAVDDVNAKTAIIKEAKAKNIPVISAMGAGNKTDPTRFRVSDIYKTSVCPLAKVMRKRRKDEGIKSLQVVWSDEAPAPMKSPGSIGSLAFVVGTAVFVMAGEVIKDLAGIK